MFASASALNLFLRSKTDGLFFSFFMIFTDLKLQSIQLK